jgi:hypothetical protein
MNKIFKWVHLNWFRLGLLIGFLVISFSFFGYYFILLRQTNAKIMSLQIEIKETQEKQTKLNELIKNLNESLKGYQK